jgi:hypothetical protein
MLDDIGRRQISALRFGEHPPELLKLESRRSQAAVNCGRAIDNRHPRR